MKHLRLTAAVLALLTLAACSKDDKDETQRTALKVTSANINASTTAGTDTNNRTAASTTAGIPATRATDNAWQAGDAIGITMLDAATSLPTEGRTVYKYVTSTDGGSFAPADATNTAYYPDAQGSTVNIFAFYPYRELGSDLMIPINTADQSSLSSIDFMAADASTGHSKDAPEVSLGFSHKLVKLVVCLDSKMLGEGIDLTGGATLTLQGTNTTAQWDLKNAQLTGIGNTADIDIPTVWNSTLKQFEGTAIVLPTGAEANVKLIIKIGGKTFEASLKAGTALVPGTINTLNVELTLTEAVINATVTDWTTGVTADLKTLPITVTATSGNAAGISNLTLWTEAAPAAKAAYTWNAAAGKWNSNAPFYLDNLTTTDAFYARHTPTQADGSTPVVDPVSGWSDILGNTTPATISGGGISLTLEHLMAKLNISLAASSDFPASLSTAGAGLTLNGFLTGMALDDRNVVTASGSSLAASGDSYSLTTDAAGNASLLVAPQNIAAGTHFIIHIEGAPADYTATLTDDLQLAAGTISTVKLTVRPMEPAISVSVKEWATGDETEQAIVLDGISTSQGGVTSSYEATTGDVLSIAAGASGTAGTAGTSGTAGTFGTAGASASYLYSAATQTWTSIVPLYWDNLETADSYTFHALITPTAAGTPEKDYLSGTTTADFGQAISFSGSNSLTHLMSQLTVVLKPGTGYSIDELKQARVSLLKGYATLTGTLAPGDKLTTDASALTAPASDDYALATGPANDHSLSMQTLLLCPQSWARSSVILTVQMPAGGPVYRIKAPDSRDFNLAPGTRNKITTTISKTDVDLSFNVTEWVDGNNDIDANGDLVDPVQ